jgi:hypothetical protein
MRWLVRRAQQKTAFPDNIGNTTRTNVSAGRTITPAYIAGLLVSGTMRGVEDVVQQMSVSTVLGRSLRNG